MSQSNVQRNNANANLILWPSLFVLLFGIAVVGLASFHADIAAAWRSATTHQPEAYSELYFDNPARLPGYTPATKQQAVAFHIVNHEHTVHTYEYETSVTIQGITSTHSYRLQLADGQGAAETLKFTIPKPGETAVITILLIGTDQRLTFRSAS